MVFWKGLCNKQKIQQCEHPDLRILIDKLKEYKFNGGIQITEIYQQNEKILQTYYQEVDNGKRNFLLHGMNHTQSLLIINVLSELKGMVSFIPGRVEGIEWIVSLLEWIILEPSAGVLDLYRRDEWKQIVDLRGPVESILREKCEECGNIYYSMGISGFLDKRNDMQRSGDVYFKPNYDNSAVPKCLCGGDYEPNCCPECNSIDRKIVGEMSPYEYFYSHKYIRGDKK